MGTIILVVYFFIAGVLGSIVMRILSGGYPELASKEEKEEFLNMPTWKKIVISVIGGAFWPALIGLGLMIHVSKEKK